MIPASHVWRIIGVQARRAAAWPFRVAAARASLRTLAKMDRRELADIGLNPSDVRDASALPLDGDPTELLARRARERRENAFGPPPSRAGRSQPGGPDGRPGRNRPPAAARAECGREGRRPRQNRLSCAPASRAFTIGLRKRSVRSAREVSRKPRRRAAISNRRPIIQA